MRQNNLSGFVATGSAKQIFKLLDSLRGQGYIPEGDTNCMITGESGAGKSELVKQYALKNPRSERAEYTHIPVLYVELNSPMTKNELAEQILIALGDPQKGKVFRSKKRPFAQIADYCRDCGVELIILDEVQTAIQNRSIGVMANIADWFKDLMNITERPIVMVGMPWCRGFVEKHDQLDTRVGYRYYLETFRVSKNFSHFKRFVELFSRNYQFAKGFSLMDAENAYRLFAYSSGIVRSIKGQIIGAEKIANSIGKPIDLACFQEAIRIRGIKDEDNVFLMPITELRIREIVNSSRWIQQKSYDKERFKSAEFKTYRLTKNLDLFEEYDG